MRNKFMIFIHFISYKIACYNNGDKVIGAIGAMMIVMPPLFVMLRLFNFYVMDINGALASCCAIGPVTAKNTFSVRAIGYAVVTVPIMLLLGAFIVRRSDEMKKLFSGKVLIKHDKIALAVPCFVFIFSLPKGMQGDMYEAWSVLLTQGCVFVAYTVFIHRRLAVTLSQNLNRDGD